MCDFFFFFYIMHIPFAKIPIWIWFTGKNSVKKEFLHHLLTNGSLFCGLLFDSLWLDLIRCLLMSGSLFFTNRWLWGRLRKRHTRQQLLSTGSGWGEEGKEKENQKEEREKEQKEGRARGPWEKDKEKRIWIVEVRVWKAEIHTHHRFKHIKHKNKSSREMQWFVPNDFP